MRWNSRRSAPAGRERPNVGGTTGRGADWPRGILPTLALGAGLAFGSLALAGHSLADDTVPPPAPGVERSDQQPEQPSAPPAAGEKSAENRAAEDRAIRDDAAASGTAARNEERRSDGAWIRFSRPDLRFEQSRFADEATLLVRDREGGDVWVAHRGPDLDSILRANAALASRTEIAALKREVSGASERVAVKAEKSAPGFVSEVRTFVEAPGLLLERRGPDETWLFVDDEGGTERVFIGHDLDAIAKAHPDLEQRTGFPALRAKVREVDLTKPAIKSGATAIVDVRHSDQQVVVTAHTLADGRWTAKTFRGKTLADIAAHEMELQRILVLPAMTPPTAAGMSEPHAMQHPGPAPEPGLEDGRVDATRTERFSASAERFAPESRNVGASVGPKVGAGLRRPCGAPAQEQPIARAPSGVLPMHPTQMMPTQATREGFQAGVPSSGGAVLTEVRAGSIASSFGLQSGDVVLEVDGRPVTDRAAFERDLERVGASARPSIVVLRHGNRITLGR